MGVYPLLNLLMLGNGKFTGESHIRSVGQIQPLVQLFAGHYTSISGHGIVGSKGRLDDRTGVTRCACCLRSVTSFWRRCRDNVG